MAHEASNVGAGGVGGWPDDAGDVLFQLAMFYGIVRRSLRAAAFGWSQAGSDARAAYLDELARLREKENQVWRQYLQRPLTDGQAR